MNTLIDKLQPTALSSNIPTVGYQTLFCLLANGAEGASNYTGTKAEADTLIAGMTIKVADNTSDSGADIDAQYVKARTIAGTKNAILEIVLTKAYVKTLSLGSGISATAKFYTLPSNSQV